MLCIVCIKILKSSSIKKVWSSNYWISQRVLEQWLLHEHLFREHDIAVVIIDHGTADGSYIQPCKPVTTLEQTLYFSHRTLGNAERHPPQKYNPQTLFYHPQSLKGNWFLTVRTATAHMLLNWWLFLNKTVTMVAITLKLEGMLLPHYVMK